MAALAVVPVVTPVFVVFLCIATLLASLLHRLGRLPTRSGRVLLFSFSTRNSFVVLPLALNLPPGWEEPALVIVMQSLVELIGMAVMVWVGSRWWYSHRRRHSAAVPLPTTNNHACCNANTISTAAKIRVNVRLLTRCAINAAPACAPSTAEIEVRINKITTSRSERQADGLQTSKRRVA